MSKKVKNIWNHQHATIGRAVAFYDSKQNQSFRGVVISRTDTMVVVQVGNNTITIPLDEVTPLFSS